MPVRATAATVSKCSRREDIRNGIIAQSRTTGATRRVPAASASHHVNQVRTVSETLTLLASIDPAKTTIELIIVVGAKQTIANFTTPEAVLNISRPFDQRQINHVPANEARRVPIPIETSSKSDRPTIKLQDADAIRIAGQIL